MKKMYRHLRAIAIIVGLIIPALTWAYDPVTPPAWIGEPGRVRHLYLFPNNSMTPFADESDNPFGTAAAVISLGQFAAGWQDPDPTLDVPESYGEPDSGAWDLGKGPAGEIRVTVPIGNIASTPGFAGYRVKVQVNVVAYDLLVTLPTLASDGYWLGSRKQTDTLAFFGWKFGFWYNRTWTATLYNVREDHVTLVISANADMGSLIDAVEIYAVASEDTNPSFTALGTPLAWYRSFNIDPKEGNGWNDADYYDSDGDGMLNWQEYVAGTNPNDPQSLLKIVKIRANMGEPPYLEWIGGKAGPVAPYIVESTTSLNNPDWQPIGTRERVDGLNDWLGEGMPILERQRFFRIIAPRDAKP